MQVRFDLDVAALDGIRDRELAKLWARTPRAHAFFAKSRTLMPDGVPSPWMTAFYPGMEIVADHGAGAHFTDIDGNRFLDMSQCDLSMSCGFGPVEIARAVSSRFENGSHFLLPTEDSIAVCELLRERYAMPAWRFTLSASGANTEAIRIARCMTGRDMVLSFAGKYHGHIDETLTIATGAGMIADQKGIPGIAIEHTIEVPFNDIAAVKDALASGRVACVITEPVMTNLGVIYPADGFLDELRAITRATGTLLVIDEAHTQAAYYGGFTRRWALEPDILTLGKSMGGGLPFGAYGMTDEIKAFVERHAEPRVPYGDAIALGGTTYGNAVNMAAARAALSEVLTEAAYLRLGKLGETLADGIESVLRRFDLPWSAQRLGNRSGVFLSATPPRNADEAAAALSKPYNLAQRAFMATRGIWEPIYIHGPSLSFAHGPEEVATYLDSFAAWISLIATCGRRAIS